jgi:hypothetical protein
MSHQKLVNYLITSSVTGGALGAIHGKMSSTQKQTQDEHIKQMAEHGVTGLFLGPWAPVALPFWMWNQPNVKCPKNPQGRGPTTESYMKG